MITARLHSSVESLAARLSRKAALLAQAALTSRRITHGDPARWRSARLLWPLFTRSD